MSSLINKERTLSGATPSADGGVAGESLRWNKERTLSGATPLKMVPIKDVQPGMMVYSLNEELGIVEPHRINALLDMGVKPVFKLTTEDGRSIRTTGNHPYLVRDNLSDEHRQAIALRRLEKLMRSYALKQESLSEQTEFSQVKNLWLLDSTTNFGFQGSNAFMHINGHMKFFTQSAHFFTQVPYIIFNSIDLFIKSSDFGAQFCKSSFSFSAEPCNFTFNDSQLRSNYVLQSFLDTFIDTRRHSNLLCHLKDTIRSIICQDKNSNLAFASIPDFKAEFNASWLKVIYLQEGDEIAIVDVTTGVAAERLRKGRKIQSEFSDLVSLRPGLGLSNYLVCPRLSLGQFIYRERGESEETRENKVK